MYRSDHDLVGNVRQEKLRAIVEKVGNSVAVVWKELASS
jgi:hypothetical protein